VGPGSEFGEFIATSLKQVYTAVCERKGGTMQKAMTLFLVIIVLAIISLPLCGVTSAGAANSVTYTLHVADHPD
jgi:hypothetical protein